MRISDWISDVCSSDLEVAIITAIHHEKSHENTAYEIFYPDGPFAVLPMLPETRSAIVWTVPKKRAPAMLALNERAFVVEMQKRIGGFIGDRKSVVKDKGVSGRGDPGGRHIIKK